jgi:hypothetical protein
MSTLSTTNLKNPSSGSNNIVLAADGTTTITAPSNIIKSGTAVASTSGTAIDFTGIPSWVKRITVMFSGVSTNGTSVPLIQIGNGTIQVTGYSGASSILSGSGTTNNNFTTGFGAGGASAANVLHGSFYLTLIDSANTWVISGAVGGSSAAFTVLTGGSKTLSDTLDRIRITTANGTDTFDAGSVNILFEG